MLSFFVVPRRLFRSQTLRSHHAKLGLPPRSPGAAWDMSPSGPYRPHRHSELEINLVIAGSARYLIGEKRYDLGPDMLLWLFPRQDHVLIDYSTDFRMWVVVFRPWLVRRHCTSPATAVLRRGNPPGLWLRQLAPADAQGLNALFQRLSGSSGYAMDPAVYETTMAYALLRCWEKFVAASELLSEVANVHPSIERAARLIRSEPEAMEWKLEELADRCGLSAARLSRLFKQQTGVPLAQYRARIALERFLHRYPSERNSKTMLAVALDCGFGSYAQFHRVFRQMMGISPRRYTWPDGS